MVMFTATAITGVFGAGAALVATLVWDDRPNRLIGTAANHTLHGMGGNATGSSASRASTGWR